MLNPMQPRGTILLQPRLVNSYYNLGLIRAQQQDWNAAIAAYTNALKLEENWFIYFGLGEVYAQSGEEIQAIHYYQKTIDLQPDRAEVYHQLGDLLHKQQRWNEAILAYQKAIELNPDFFWSYNNLGDCFRDFQRWQEAEFAYSQAIDLNPSFVFSHYNLGEVCAKQEKWKAAIPAYRKAIELDPNFADAYSNLGDALKKDKQWDEAITSYEKAIEIEPSLHFSVYQSLGDLLSKQQALKLMNLKSERQHTRLLSDGDEIDTIQAYYQEWKINSKTIEPYVKIANSCANNDRPELAIIYYQIARQIQPENTDLHKKVLSLKKHALEG